MPAITSTAPGKIILFGEHSVVYGRPAIAAPVSVVKARAIVIANPKGVPGSLRIHAPDIKLDENIKDLAIDHPLAYPVNAVLKELGMEKSPACTIRITSTIPVSSGLGSGTAVSVAVLRAFSEFLGNPLTDERVSALAFEVDKLHHGTPSGIDNTVITHAQPIYFSDEERFEFLRVAIPFDILIGDTGMPTPTAIAVRDLRNAWITDPAKYESIFDAVGDIVKTAKNELESGQLEALGLLMEENQRLLVQMGISSPELGHLIEIAKSSDALGAKLSGGGRGGNMIALVTEDSQGEVADALLKGGAKRVMATTIKKSW